MILSAIALMTSSYFQYSLSFYLQAAPAIMTPTATADKGFGMEAVRKITATAAPDPANTFAAPKPSSTL